MTSKNQENKNLKANVGFFSADGKDNKITMPPETGRETKTFLEIYNEALMEIKTTPFHIEKRRGKLVRVSEDGKELSVVGKEKAREYSKKLGKLGKSEVSKIDGLEGPILNQEENLKRGKELTKLLGQIDENEKKARGKKTKNSENEEMSK